MNINTEEIKKIIRGSVLTNEPLSRHTTFRSGGTADVFVIPRDTLELSELIMYARQQCIPFFILGNGSNVLASDQGYRGMIINISRDWAKCSWKTDERGIFLYPGAGCLMSELGQRALRLSASGFEALSGIPGSLGGAVIMNAGAFGSELKDVLVNVMALSPAGEPLNLSVGEAGLRYRGSRVMDEGLIVTGAVIRLSPGDPGAIAGRMEELMRRRQDKQPLEYPSAGSTFKRPEGDFAGRLISEAGLKGLSVGGAQVSEKHAGFIINRHRASSADIYRLIKLVQERVFDSSGVRLEPEVRFLGDFNE